MRLLRCLPWLLVLLAGRVQAAEEIVLASPDYWCPFSCKAGSAQEGFTVDIIRRVFAGHDISVRLINLNYNRALRAVREGQYAGTPSTLKDEAPDFIYPALPVSSNRFCFFTRPESAWSYSGEPSLSGQRTAVVQGYAYSKSFDQFIEDHPQQFVSLSGDNLTDRQLTLLQRQRITAFLEEESLVLYAQLQSGRPGSLRNAGCLPRSYAFLALSPANPRSQEYARLFDAGMRQLRASGELARILGLYGLRDWQQ